MPRCLALFLIPKLDLRTRDWEIWLCQALSTVAVRGYDAVMCRAVLLVLAASVVLAVHGVGADDAPSLYAKWAHGPSSDAGFFPIAVWLQNPANAERFRAAGMNTYVGLWKGPTEAQLAALDKSGMKLICEQNAVALGHLDDPAIIGWLQPDEPDNAQERTDHHGYGPPTAPEKIVDQYTAWKQADPTRPILLGMGQGVAWNDYYGRGVRTGHAEDYPEYAKGGDILSFDIYPVVHENPAVAGKLWFVARGVDHLVQIAHGEKVVWNCIECTHIENAKAKATPQQVRAEVWMSLIHGSRGIIWFVHQFAPRFREAALLDDPEMLAAVTAINRQIMELAPVLNSPNIIVPFHGEALDANSKIDWVLKRDEHSTYIFAVETRGVATKAVFGSPRLRSAHVTVIGENRTIETGPGDVDEGSFSDIFAPWDVHLYQIKD